MFIFRSVAGRMPPPPQYLSMDSSTVLDCIRSTPTLIQLATEAISLRTWSLCSGAPSHVSCFPGRFDRARPLTYVRLCSRLILNSVSILISCVYIVISDSFV